MGYAVSNFSQPSGRPYLPCPDINVAISGFTPNDGLEDRNPTTGACAAEEGNVPWATLGAADADSWGNRFRYRVHPKFSNKGDGLPATTNDGFKLDTSLASSPSLRVCTGTVSGCTSTLASQVPAVILSHGKNGPSPSTADEQENISAITETVTVTFVSRTITSPQTPCSDSAPGPAMPFCEFDDLVTWLSPNILFNRMVAAGRLP